ncbi:[NiFe]-hydrogenase assembly chaperone HybE [Maritimibacter dapengensis]|uniref:[NiFe]-hydrogenase assembly chaperone HybE n=1 Tax=Maritimibacter dapengensis TaxID=2836868 RepID=A0ABS6T6J8_9RHOB|nr:[NiFe]-hydrogenase assembly chaperone HybE [Maritimibacter dapengensis]MBV7380774.1 [NiFe]-hydrogenase assembly chaperone HybE [Maritimibacter dapengensis]
MTGFEGSYLGAADKISPQAIMECKVCWTPYDPAEGDDFRQIEPGTAFVDLPEDWSCPNCSSPKDQFLVAEDPGSQSAADIRLLDDLTAKLVADFTEVWNGTMRDVPLVNAALRVQAVGWRIHEGRPLGVLMSPWFMNLVQLPGEDEDWSGLVAGDKETIAFPSGEYEFIHNRRDMIGGYKACSLFSPMGDFNTQAQAVEVAEAVMVELFKDENRAETDRAQDIRAARESEIAALEEAGNGNAEGALDDDRSVISEPTRRQILTGGLSE